MSADERLGRYAHLAVEVGVNLAPGQPLFVTAHPDHLSLVREIARVAYELGASYVEVLLDDPMCDTLPRSCSTGRRRGCSPCTITSSRTGARTSPSSATPSLS